MKMLFGIIKLIALTAIASITSLSAMAQKSLTVTGPNAPLRDGNVRVSPTDGVQGVNLGSFQVSATGGDCSLVNVTVQIRNVGNNGSPATLSVYDGSTLIRSVAVTQLIVGIPLDGQTVPQNSARTFTVKGDFPSTAAGTCQVQILGVRWLNSQNAGASTGPSGGDLYGPTCHLYGSIAFLQLASAPAAFVSSDLNSFTTSATAVFSFNVSAIGANLSLPVNSDAVVTALFAASGQAVNCPTVSVVTIPNNAIADGSVAQVTVTAMLPASSVPGSGLVTFALSQFTWHSALTGGVSQNWGLEDYVTPNAVNFLKPEATPPARNISVIGSDLYLLISYLKETVNGVPGQVAGEGGTLKLASTMPNPVTRVVFKNDSPSGGNIAQVGASISATDMTPVISAPADLSKIAPVTYTNYPVSNVQSVSLNGSVVQKTFDVVLGTVTLHGVMVRTGNSSCGVTFYWGTGSSSTSPGADLDLLNLSPGDGPDQPQRFKLGTTGANFSGSSFQINLWGIPGTFRVLGSSDLKTWTAVSSVPVHDMSLSDSDGSAPGTVSMDPATLVGAGLSPGRCFFKLVLN